MKKLLALALISVMFGVTVLPSQAESRGWVGVNLGCCGYYPYYSPYYYGYPAYYGYPSYYTAPPVVYAQPPTVVYAQPATTVYAAPQAQQPQTYDQTNSQAAPQAPQPQAYQQNNSAGTAPTPTPAPAPAPASAPVAPVSSSEETAPENQASGNFVDGFGRTCRKFQTSIDDAVVNGTACLQADGTWSTVAQ